MKKAGRSESKELRIVVDVEGTRRKLLWMSLQSPTPTKREAISVGFADRAFRVPGLESRVVLEDVVHAASVDLRERHRTKALTNPHFTFHAPAWMHLRANGEERLTSQFIGGMDLALETQPRVP